MQPRPNGSVRLKHNHSVSNQKKPSNLEQESPKCPAAMSTLQVAVFDADGASSISEQRTSTTSDSRIRRKGLSKTKDDDLKFIDTSLESELPPTLSQLQRKSVQISTDHQVPTSSSSLQANLSSPTTPINSSSSNQLNSIDVAHHKAIGSHGSRDVAADSAVEDSITISLEQVEFHSAKCIRFLVRQHDISFRDNSKQFKEINFLNAFARNVAPVANR